MQRESVKRSFSPALTLASGMILSESLNLSEPQFSPLLNGANNSSLAPSALAGLRLNESALASNAILHHWSAPIQNCLLSPYTAL